jgi:hypothetical protein
MCLSYYIALYRCLHVPNEQVFIILSSDDTYPFLGISFDLSWRGHSRHEAAPHKGHRLREQEGRRHHLRVTVYMRPYLFKRND